MMLISLYKKWQYNKNNITNNLLSEKKRGHKYRKDIFVILYIYNY